MPSYAYALLRKTKNHIMKEGSVVYLKSGSPAMTIKGEDYLGYWICNWFVGTDVREHSFPAIQLTETNPNRISLS